MDEINDFFGNDDYEDDDQEPMADEAIEDNTPEGGTKRTVEPKLDRIKKLTNPHLALNEKILTGPKGIAALRETFKDFKPDPKGDPYANLDKLMKKYAYWGHLMFPRMKTEDVLARVETLGTRRQVKVHLAKTRLGMEEPEVEVEKKNDIIDDGAEEKEEEREEEEGKKENSPKKTSRMEESAIDMYEEEEMRMMEEERLREEEEERVAAEADEIMADFGDDW